MIFLVDIAHLIVDVFLLVFAFSVLVPFALVVRLNIVELGVEIEGHFDAIFFVLDAFVLFVSLIFVRFLFGQLRLIELIFRFDFVRDVARVLADFAIVHARNSAFGLVVFVVGLLLFRRHLKSVFHQLNERLTDGETDFDRTPMEINQPEENLIDEPLDLSEDRPRLRRHGARNQFGQILQLELLKRFGEKVENLRQFRRRIFLVVRGELVERANETFSEATNRFDVG